MPLGLDREHADVLHPLEGPVDLNRFAGGATVGTESARPVSERRDQPDVALHGNPLIGESLHHIEGTQRVVHVAAPTHQVDCVVEDLVGRAELLPGAADAHEVVRRDPAGFVELFVPDHQQINAGIDAGSDLGRVRRVAHRQLRVGPLEGLEVGDGVVASRGTAPEVVDPFHQAAFLEPARRAAIRASPLLVPSWNVSNRSSSGDSGPP